MAIPGSFRELQDEIFPRWCRRPKMAAFLAAFSEKKDELVDRLAGSILARSSDRAPDDALEAVGGNFYLSRALHDTAATFRAYLRRPFTRWRKAATPQGMREELAHLGYASTEIISYRDLVDGGLPGTVFGGVGSFWFLRINKPNSWGPPGHWGDGSRWGAAPYTWGSSATAQEIDEIRRVIAKWKPASTSCRFIEAVLEVDMFGAATKVVRWPVREPWELDARGAAKDYYNTGYGP